MVAFRGADKFLLLLLDRPDYREALPVFFLGLSRFLTGGPSSCAKYGLAL